MNNKLIFSMLGGVVASSAALPARETLTTPSVGGTEAQLRAAAANSAPAGLNAKVSMPAETLLGGSPNEVRAMLEKEGRDAAEALKTKRASKVESFGAKAAVDGIPLITRGELGTSLFAGFDERGLPVRFGDTSFVQAQQAGTSELWPGGITGYDLSGTDAKVGMWDLGGVPRSTHDDFLNTGSSRIAIQAGQGSTISSHATSVAGVLGGGGVEVNPLNSSDTSSGMAFEGTVQAWDFSAPDDDLIELLGIPIDQLRTTNHSYGQFVGWTIVRDTLDTVDRDLKAWLGDLALSTTESYLFGRYNVVSSNTDFASRFKPWTLPVWAAGNDRDDTLASLTAGTYIRVNKGATNQGATYFRAYHNGVKGFYNGSKFWAESGGTWTNPNSTPPVYKVANSATAITLSGTSVADGGTTGFDSIPEGSSTAKNTLTVGAINGSNVTAAFSVYGPTDDGRIKPDVVAGGVDVFTASGTSDSAFTSGTGDASAGTSFSAPVVTGSVALLAELQESLWGDKEPLFSSTYRALAIHTASDLGTTGPDYSTGWGRVDFTSAAGTVEANHASTQRTYLKETYIPDGQEANFTVKAAGGSPVKVTLAWIDPSGTPQAAVLDPTSPALVNNIDLRVYKLNPDGTNGTEFKPWILDPASPSSAATKNQNDRDNVEQVVTTTATSGSLYRVIVKQKAGTPVVNDAGAPGVQPVSLVLSGVVNRDIPFAITGVSYAFSGGNVKATLTWGSHAGEWYKIEYSTDLQNWTECAESINTGDDSTTAVSDSVPASPSKYFRVKTVSPNHFGY